MFTYYSVIFGATAEINVLKHITELALEHYDSNLGPHTDFIIIVTRLRHNSHCMFFVCYDGEDAFF